MRFAPRFALLDKTAEPHARSFLEPRASGILCQSHSRRAVKIVSFASLAPMANVKISVALFWGGA